MALKAALNDVRANFGTGGIRADVKRADKVGGKGSVLFYSVIQFIDNNLKESSYLVIMLIELD